MRGHRAKQETKAILDGERAINEQYLREIEALLQNQPHLMKHIAVLQSQHWTTAALPRPGVDGRAVSAVIGRVALEDDHPFSDTVGTTFYIGGWRIEKDDFETVNWAAPIARLFFEGRASNYELAPAVVGRRTFVLRLDDLIDFHDQEDVPGSAPFDRATRALQVPAAPTSRRRDVDGAKTDVAPAQAKGECTEDAERARSQDVPLPSQQDVGAETDVELIEAGAVLDRTQGLRAANAVIKVMGMPKTGRMGVVLPTMQPDQYRLVSWPNDRPLIVQGQPGTGKTVIAAHRAVYLTSAERHQDRVARVGIVGPSDNYVEHVAPIVSELKEPEAEVRIMSLPALLQSIVGLRSRPKLGPIGRIESSWELGRALEDLVRLLTTRPATGPFDRQVRQITDALRAAEFAGIVDAEIRSFLRSLPSWAELSSQARYLPMLATIALTLRPRAVGDLVGHLIVDETQDVRPLEWRLLTRSLLGPGGHMSLFGDMNQRRSDWTASSWHQLALDLELTDDEGGSSVEKLDNGYRSTRQILRFANQLLPRGARGERALREGPEPRIHKVSADERTRAAVEEAIQLLLRHDGMVAVISVAPTPISTDFRRRNWARGRLQHSWTLNGRTIVVFHPDEARGLEFDGAVVVEPTDFPENVGRQGVLYTSLTRANKELTVVHSKTLPKELRVQRRR